MWHVSVFNYVRVQLCELAGLNKISPGIHVAISLNSELANDCYLYLGDGDVYVCFVGRIFERF